MNYSKVVDEKEMKDSTPIKEFDTAFILSSAILWIVLGFFMNVISCDIQYLMTNNAIFKHALGIVSFFFLFSVIGNKNKSHIGSIWLKTIIIYVLFILLSKSKWYFSIPVIVLLLIDQSIYIQEQYNQQNHINFNKESYETCRKFIEYVIYGLIIVSFVIYSIRQYNEFGENFKFSKLFLDFSCNAPVKSMPNQLPNPLPNQLPKAISNLAPQGMPNIAPRVMPNPLPKAMPNLAPQGMPNLAPQGMPNLV